MGKMIRYRRSHQGEPRRMPLNYKFVSDSLIFPLSVPQENERSAQAFTFRTVFCASKCKDVTYYFCKKHVRPVLRWCLQYRSRWEMTIDIIVLQSHNQCSPLLYDITTRRSPTYLEASAQQSILLHVSVCVDMNVTLSLHLFLLHLTL